MNGMTKEAVFQFFAGHATAPQKRFIQEWLTDAKHVEIFYEWLEEWEDRHPQYVPDLDTAAEKYKATVNKCSTIETSTIHRVATQGRSKIMYRLRWSFSIAAALLIGFFIFHENILYTHFKTGNGEIRTVVLADQSSVILNANSDLRVPRFLSLISGRTVSLKGEAIFNVKHEAGNRSFEVIMPNQWKIQVLGTEFNVYARNAESKVFLNRGSIRLLTRSADKEPLMLKPGDLVTEDKNKVIQRSSNRSLVEFGGWKDHVFNFNATPLSRVAQMLEDQFGKKISIADTALANRNISGSCRWETEDDILINLSMMMKFNVIQVNDSIVLK
jgi:transmembrane sensor